MPFNKLCTKRLLISTNIFLFAILHSFSVSCQSFIGVPDFSIFTPEEIALKKCEFDPGASAVVLLDVAISNHDYLGRLTTDYRVRIKILNDKGLDYANIAIPFYVEKDFTPITNVKGFISTYDENGIATSSVLDEKSIYNVKSTEKISDLKFTMPNVKVGSIFEYTYTVTKGGFLDIDDWFFQQAIPTYKSRYQIHMIRNAEFAYQVIKLSSIPIKITNEKEKASVLFEMDNIPALKNEPFMDSRQDNLQRVTFQLSQLTYSKNLSRYSNKIFTSWESLSDDLLSKFYIDEPITAPLSNTRDFITQTNLLPDTLGRVKAVFKFVQDNMSWNGGYSLTGSKDVEEVWNRKKGTNANINLIFINLLRKVGVQAFPLLVSEREHGKVLGSYPFIDQFNKSITYLTIAEKKWFIDAADKETPIHIVPFNLLNTTGFIVDKTKGGLLTIENKKLYHENLTNIMGELSDSGVLTGTVVQMSSDYSKLARKKYYLNEGTEKFTERYFRRLNNNVKTDTVQIKNLDNELLPLEQKLQFSETLNNSGDYILLDYHLFSDIPKNPFISDLRFSDINFGCPQRYIVNQSIALPEGFTVEEVPKNVRMVAADTSFTLIRRIAVQDERISSQLKVEINQSLFKQEDYEMLQAFFKKMQGVLDEQIVLKKKK